jgi:hypothetical protein
MSLLQMVYAAFVCTNMESDGRGVTHPHVLSAYEELPTHEAVSERVSDGRVTMSEIMPIRN